MTEKEQNKIYKKLREIYSDEEIAESMIFSSDFTHIERAQLQEIIKKRREHQTEKEKKEIEEFIKQITKKDDHKNN